MSCTSSPCVTSSPWARKGRFFGILGLGSPTRRSGDSGDEEEEDDEAKEVEDDEVDCLHSPARPLEPLSPIQEVDTHVEIHSPLVVPGAGRTPLNLQRRRSERDEIGGDMQPSAPRVPAMPQTPPSAPNYNTPVQAPPTPLQDLPPPRPAADIHEQWQVAESQKVVAPAVQGRKVLHVNGIPYVQLKTLGKGGSSKVYLVRSPEGEELALKKVSTDRQFEAMMSEEERRSRGEKLLKVYKEEVDLLLQLRNHDCVIQVVDAEVDTARGIIYIVMETGDMDLATYLNTNPRLNLRQIQSLWRQMLQAVQVIHERRIIHNDLKPGNFLLVQGRLKVIDFGIAKRLDNDTTNVIGTGQGTMSYMAPEAAAFALTPGGTKVGRSVDVWSLGIILYQMVYEHTPFADLDKPQRLLKLNDPSTVIDLPLPQWLSLHPSHTQAALMDVLRRCLQRNPTSRPKLAELLSHDLLRVETDAARHAERLASLRAQREELKRRMCSLDLEIEVESRLLSDATAKEAASSLIVYPRAMPPARRASEPDPFASPAPLGSRSSLFAVSLADNVPGCRDGDGALRKENDVSLATQRRDSDMFVTPLSSRQGKRLSGVETSRGTKSATSVSFERHIRYPLTPLVIA